MSKRTLSPADLCRVANFMIGRAKSRKASLTHLKLQKLVYIAYGIGLAVGRRLFQDRVEAWSWGPVIPSLYHEFKRYGASEIDDWSIYYSYEKRKWDFPTIPDEDREALLILNMTWDFYGRLSGSQLTRLTHQRGTPWDKTPLGETIPDYEIGEHFAELFNVRSQAPTAARRD